ncbi:hypothetical protein GOV09_05075 [Candidatus Woesearchaeota archaeon]|nr:hypothetical protein [Candidatus Woesearchaeota archaeon]
MLGAMYKGTKRFIKLTLAAYIAGLLTQVIRPADEFVRDNSAPIAVVRDDYVDITNHLLKGTYQVVFDKNTENFLGVADKVQMYHQGNVHDQQVHELKGKLENLVNPE